MNFAQRTQTLVYAFLISLVLMNIPVYFLWVRPEIRAHEKQSERIAASQLQVKAGISNLNALKEFELKLAQSRKSYEEFTTQYLFSRENRTSELIRELDEICVEAGLLRNRVTYKPEADVHFGLQKVSITLPIEGSYTNIREFLNLLESSSKFISVDSMSLESEREGTGLIRMDMTLSTLFGAQP